MQAMPNSPPRKTVLGSVGSGISSASSTAARKVFFSVTVPTVWPRVTPPSVSLTATNSWCVSAAISRSSLVSVEWLDRGLALFARGIDVTKRFRRANGGPPSDHVFGIAVRLWVP
jgi:hypothetical protein